MSEVVDFNQDSALHEELDQYIKLAEINIMPSTLREAKKELLKFQEYLLHNVAGVDDDGKPVLSEGLLQYCDLLNTMLEQHSFHEEFDHYIKLAKVNIKPSTKIEAKEEQIKFQEYLLFNVAGVIEDDGEKAVPTERLLKFCDLLETILERNALQAELEYYVKLSKINMKPSTVEEAQIELIKFQKYLLFNVAGDADDKMAVPGKRLLQYAELLESIFSQLVGETIL